MFSGIMSAVSAELVVSRTGTSVKPEIKNNHKLGD